MEVNNIYNEDCRVTMRNMVERGLFPNIILTSPPYNTSKKSGSRDDHQNRYDVHIESMSQDEYIRWSLELFDIFKRVLSKDGVILYNLSYASGKINEKVSQQMHLLIADIIRNTDFMVADIISWKKSSAIPDNMTPNKATRITEFIYVFCRKSEYHTFKSNKKVVNTMPHNGVKVYDTFSNFIEAKNNDYCSKLNKATFSSELVKELLKRYSTEGDIIYDPFIGTGTTARAILTYNKENDCNLKYIGSEISSGQIEEFHDLVERLDNDVV